MIKMRLISRPQDKISNETFHVYQYISERICSDDVDLSTSLESRTTENKMDF